MHDAPKPWQTSTGHSRTGCLAATPVWPRCPIVQIIEVVERVVDRFKRVMLARRRVIVRIWTGSKRRQCTQMLALTIHAYESRRRGADI
ncbi:hypothetical protein WL93_20410 [Burkholderia diffusa]|nr:hypothetical protein WL93_20410 [Burkholderia diffusa]